MSRGLADFPIGQVIVWYLILLTFQLAVWPVVYRYAQDLSDRGYCVGRLVGLLSSGWLCWSGWVYGVWRLEAGSAWVCLMGVAALGWGMSFMGASAGLSNAPPRTGEQPEDGPLTWIRRNLRLVGSLEAVFLLAFLLLLILRTMLPVASHTEQPSDLMLMSSIGHSPDFPVQDAWLAGFPVSYYYFGYWLQVFVGKLVGIPPTLVYSLGLASLFALLCSACFGVGYNLVSAESGTSRDRGSLLSKESHIDFRRGVFGGTAAVLIVCLAGNFRTLYDLIWYAASRSDWWWLSSRAIRDIDLSGRSLPAITEFPAFSFVLGDNHPHVQSAPVLVLLSLVLLNALLVWSRTESRARGRPKRGLALRENIVLGFLLGALAAVNSWDLVAGTLLIGGAALWVGFRSAAGGSPHGGHLLRAIRTFRIDLAVIPLVALLCFSPHLLTADARLHGLLPNLFFPTRPSDFIAASGPGWLGLALLASSLFLVLKRPVRLRSVVWPVAFVPAFVGGALLWANYSARIGGWMSGLGGGGQNPSSAALLRWAGEPFVASGLAVFIYIVLGLLGIRAVGSRVRGAVDADHAAEPVFGTVLILVLAGLGLLLLPELLFLHDAFGSRVNTVFKFHYGAWILLGLAGAYGLSVKPQTRFLVGLRKVALLIAAGTLVYPVAAATSRIAHSGWQVHGLDALNSVRDRDPDFYATLRWIDDHLPMNSTILESTGHREEPASSRVSVLTGHPTPVGWIDHESQWRSGEETRRMLEERAGLVATTYSARSLQVLERSLKALDVRYVYVGERERKTFGIPREFSIFDQSCRCLFRSGACRIYDCARSPLGPENGLP